MKFALQIYGSFRTFEKCLPDILNFINYESNDFDVFILADNKTSDYSILNENKVRSMLGDKIVSFEYVEDHKLFSREKENELCANYSNNLKEGREIFKQELIGDSFVTRLWYRRFLNNEMRIEHEKKTGIIYDWVIRTRFDIGFYPHRTHKLDVLTKPPPPNTMYMMPDIFSYGSPEVINYESKLIDAWPFVYNVYKQINKIPEDLLKIHDGDLNQYIRKWLFMSEANLIVYFKSSPYNLNILPLILRITRPNDII